MEKSSRHMLKLGNSLNLVPKQSCQHLVSLSSYSKICENPGNKAWILTSELSLSGRKQIDKPIQLHLLTTKPIYASILINIWNGNLRYMGLLKLTPCLKISRNACGETHLEMSKPQTFNMICLMNSNTAVYTSITWIQHFSSKTSNTSSCHQPPFHDTIPIKKYLCSCLAHF